jgi:hypothetical protein
VAALLLSACAGEGAPAPRPTRTSPGAAPSGEAPVRAGNFAACPFTAPVQTTQGFVYPPGYPADATPSPERCFQSLDDALRAGARLAPAPTGGVRVGYVYLVDADPDLAARCRAAARQLDVMVACPTLLPGPGYTSDVGTVGPRTSFAQFYIEEVFAAAPQYVGTGPGMGHLWVTTDTTAAIRPTSICAGPPSSQERTRFRGLPARWFECPKGSSTHSGHVLLSWRGPGLVYTVSLHGHSAVNRRLDWLIADSVVLVRPR